RSNWPVEGGLAAEIQRDEHVHRLGNLTLLTTSLNSTVSNGPWEGAAGKRAALHKHDVILLNRQIRDEAQNAWTEDDIDHRTQRMLEALIHVWPVPDGHTGTHEDGQTVNDENVVVRDLLSAGVVAIGDTLIGRIDSSHIAHIGEGGVLHAGGKEFASPSAAAKHLRGRQSNGWWYFRLEDGRTLRDVRREYARSLVQSTIGVPPDSA